MRQWAWKSGRERGGGPIRGNGCHCFHVLQGGEGRPGGGPVGWLCSVESHVSFAGGAGRFLECRWRWCGGGTVRPPAPLLPASRVALLASRASVGVGVVAQFVAPGWCVCVCRGRSVHAC